MLVCHIGRMGSIKKEGIITQNIYKYCDGKHIYHSIYDEDIPKANIYILHCFRNDYELFRDWDYRKDFVYHTSSWEPKIISLIHSYEPCMPNLNSDLVITISKAWQKHLKKKYSIDSIMIYPGIDLKPFENVKIDYSKNIIGRISRAEKGKFHPEWNHMILDLLERRKNVKYRLICNGYKKLPIIKHKRAKYIKGVKIDNIKKKIKELSKLSIYIDAHDDFIETFSMGLLEAMACGLPIVLLGKGQEAMCEVMGNYNPIKKLDDFKYWLSELLNNNPLKEFEGLQSRKRAQFFSLDKFVNKWNEILKRLI